LGGGLVAALGIGEEGAVAGAAGLTQRPERRLVGDERRQVEEEAAIGVGAERRVDRARGRQAVVAGGGEMGRAHGLPV
jgi:hypothetical protein